MIRNHDFFGVLVSSLWRIPNISTIHPSPPPPAITITPSLHFPSSTSRSLAQCSTLDTTSCSRTMWPITSTSYDGMALYARQNHELTFETKQYNKVWHRFRLPSQVDKFDLQEARAHLERSCTYLEDTAIRISAISFYVSPYQPEFGGWEFNVPRKDKRARV